MSGFIEYDVIECVVLSVEEMIHLELKREETGLTLTVTASLSLRAQTLINEHGPETPG